MEKMAATKEERGENREARRDGAAKGRGSWERIRWPDAKFEVTSAQCDLRNEQQREMRKERREEMIAN